MFLLLNYSEVYVGLFAIQIKQHICFGSNITRCEKRLCLNSYDNFLRDFDDKPDAAEDVCSASLH